MECLGAGDADGADDVWGVAARDLDGHRVERRVVVDDLEHELDVVLRGVEVINDLLLGGNLGLGVVPCPETAEPMDLDDLAGLAAFARGRLAAFWLLRLAARRAARREDE